MNCTDADYSRKVISRGMILHREMLAVPERLELLSSAMELIMYTVELRSGDSYSWPQLGWDWGVEVVVCTFCKAAPSLGAIIIK